jgi:membrane-associated phospholipid phosphatase
VEVDGLHRSVFNLLQMVDTPHNLAPSLHVAFSALILLGCAEIAPRHWAWGYYFWLLVLSASTVLVHQHHLFDGVSGLVLAMLARWRFQLTSA